MSEHAKILKAFGIKKAHPLHDTYHVRQRYAQNELSSIGATYSHSKPNGHMIFTHPQHGEFEIENTVNGGGHIKHLGKQ